MAEPASFDAVERGDIVVVAPGVGGRMATADGRLYGPDDKLYAHASTTCFIFDTA